MKRILLVLMVMGAFACSHAQTPRPLDVSRGVKITSPPIAKLLIADETWVVASGKNSFRIITSNDSIAHKIMAKFENHGLSKFTYTQKQDRRGSYWQRDYYFKNESWNAVADFMNTL